MNPGLAYLQRLKRERSVWLDGIQIRHVSEHPAFRGTVRTVERVLGQQIEPDKKRLLTFRTDTGKDAHKSFLIPYSRQELVQRGEAMEVWSKATFGVMSRIGVTYRAQVAGFYAGRERLQRRLPEYAQRIERYYRLVRDEDLLVTSAGHDPQVHRGKRTAEWRGDLYAALRIVQETADGVVVRGAKTLATGSPYVDEIIVSPLARKQRGEEDYAFLLMVAADTPRLHHICRESFASENTDDHPLSSRYDEMDAVLLFDDVLVPWERVLIHRDPETLWLARTAPEVGGLGLHESVVRLVSKLSFIASVANELADCIGSKRFGHVREKLVELFRQMKVISALRHYAERQASPTELGVWLPEQQALVTAKNLGNRYYPRAIEILQQLSGSGLLQTPSSLSDLDRVLEGRLHDYYQGADRGAAERGRLMKLAWELVGSPLGARHELYERYYAGDPERTYAAQYAAANKQVYIDKARLHGQAFHNGRGGNSNDGAKR